MANDLFRISAVFPGLNTGKRGEELASFIYNCTVVADSEEEAASIFLSLEVAPFSTGFVNPKAAVLIFPEKIEEKDIDESLPKFNGADS